MKEYCDYPSVNRFLNFMDELDLRPQLSPSLLQGWLELYEKRLSHDIVLEQAKVFFQEKAMSVPEGLEDLPAAWLECLPAVLWQTRKPHWEMLPYFISALGMEDGVLRMEFAQEVSIGKVGFSRFDHLRVSVNLAIAPNLWQKFTRAEEYQLWQLRPDLRQELFKVH
jgi:hypothetical protein